MGELTVPLLASQVKAAIKIHRRLQQWVTSERVLDLVAERFPAFGREETLLKVVAVNQLYGTNVYAVPRLAEHIVGLMAAKPKRDGELVERIAALPTRAGQRPRRHLSFAAKFAHFFIDAKLYPIYDSYAAKTVTYHLGPKLIVTSADHPYSAFERNFRELKDRAGVDYSTRELDRYLWLAGQYREWRTRPNVSISVEVANLFATPPRELVVELQRLMGSRVRS